MVLPKSVKEQRIIENADVYDFKLSPEDLQLMVCLGSLISNACATLCNHGSEMIHRFNCHA